MASSQQAALLVVCGLAFHLAILVNLTLGKALTGKRPSRSPHSISGQAAAVLRQLVLGQVQKLKIPVKAQLFEQCLKQGKTCNTYSHGCPELNECSIVNISAE